MTKSRWFRIRIPLFIIVLALISCSKIDPRLESALASADSLLQARVEAEEIPGAVLLVSQNEEVVHKKAYGYAHLYDYGLKRLEEPGPMTTDHLFDLASLTKVIATTSGMLLLVDQQKVDLDAPVHLYLPEFRDVHKDSATVYHLLTHTAGLYPWQPLYYHATNKQETYNYICQLPLKYPVGKERHYSDLGFMLLGYIIEQVSGQSLDVFLRENLYEPLGMNSTTFNPSEYGFTEFAATSHGNPYEYHMVADDNFGYLCHEDPESFQGWRHYTLIGEVNDGNAYYANGGVAGHAGLFSTASDLQRLLNMLLENGSYKGRQFISPEVVKEFLTKNEFGHGLGWAMAMNLGEMASPPEKVFGHGGFTGTYAVAVPEYSLVVILLTNRQNVGLGDSGYYYNVGPLRREVLRTILLALQKSTETKS